jgi:hypothetical protein
VSNEVNIKVTSTDGTGPGFKSASAGAKKVGEDVEAAGKRAGAGLDEGAKKASKFGESMRRTGEVAAGVLAADLAKMVGTKAVDFFKSSAQAASSLGESMNAVSKVFGSGAAQINHFGETADKAVGLSQRAFNELATTLGAGLRNAGLSVDQTAGKTIELTKRAADMASVFNTDVSDALEAIQAGLRGEADPLERFGVGLSAAAVQSRAMADSGKANAAELTNQELALARINIIMDQTASSAGDFAQTSNGLANAQRIATAEIENAQAKLGQGLLPVLAKGAQFAGDFAEGFGKVPGPLQAVIGGVVALSAATLLLAPRIMAAREALNEMRESESAATRGFASIASTASKMIGILGAVVTAVELIKGATSRDLNPHIDAATSGLLRYAQGLDAAGEATRIFGDNLDTIVGDFTEMDSTMAGIQNGFTFGNYMDEVNQEVKALDDSLVQMVQSGHAADAAALVEMIAERSGKSADYLLEKLSGYTSALETSKGANEGAAGAARDTAGALNDQAQSLDDVRTKWNEMNDLFFGAEEAQDAVTEATQRLNDQIAEQIENHEKGAGSFEGNTKAALENRAALRDLYSKTQDLIQVEAEHGESSAKSIKEFEKQARSMGVGKDKAHDYALALQGMADELAKLKSKTITVTVREVITRMDTGKPGTHHDYAHGGISGAASGGARGGRTLVGEEGPEIVDMPFGSTVHPAGESRAMLAGGSGGGVVYLAPLQISGGGAVDLIMQAIRDEVWRKHRGDVVVAFGTR